MTDESHKIKLLIAEDSVSVAMLLKAIFEAEDDFEVVGHAINGKEAVEMTKALNPDVITMDIFMPEMDGYEATRQIMAYTPTPIVVISSHVNDAELRVVFQAINSGALTVLEKPKGISSSEFDIVKDMMVSTVRKMSEVKVVTRKTFREDKEKTADEKPYLPAIKQTYEIVAIGASTGGPPAILNILSGLPKTFHLPIVIVQHMASGFTEGLVKWLNESVKLEVKMAEHGEALLPGVVYIAPEDVQMKIVRVKRVLAVLLDPKAAPVNNFKPSVSPLFHSLAKVAPASAIGVILTGMGSDGAEGMLEMKEAGCKTFAQDEKSCTVYGMPASAVNMGAVEKTIELDKMAETLFRLVDRRNFARSS